MGPHTLGARFEQSWLGRGKRASDFLETPIEVMRRLFERVRLKQDIEAGELPMRIVPDVARRLHAVTESKPLGALFAQQFRHLAPRPDVEEALAFLVWPRCVGGAVGILRRPESTFRGRHLAHD